MGHTYSHFNVWAVSTIVYATEVDLMRVLETYESNYKRSRSEIECGDIDYVVKESDFIALLKSLDWHPSDGEFLLNLFRLIDARGRRCADIRDPLICATVIFIKSVPRIIEVGIRIIERGESRIIDKKKLLHVLRLQNDTCHYFNDKHLNPTQLHDLIDSVFTSAGKIDGDIYYPDFIEYVAVHPIIEMFLSPQFQGSVRDKMLDENQIEEIVQKAKEY